MSNVNEADVRRDVRSWLGANWSPDHSLIDWRNMLADTGWGMPMWPKRWYGRDLPVGMGPVVDEEFERVGAVGVAKAGVRMLIAATILEHGTDQQKEKFLKRILTGEDNWCQLFSEPGSGSDLAGASTRAVTSNAGWTVNGQKVWTTSAHHANYGALVARTDPGVPKHKGLSYFIIEMDQPGVEVRQLKQMNGYASFNEVFFTDAVVHADMLLGEVGSGWPIAMTTLMHERRSADALRKWGMGTGGSGRIYEEEAAEVATLMEPYRWYPQRAGRVDLVLERARTTGQASDPVVRQAIARLLTLSHTAEWTARRARAAQELGRPQGPEGSLGKLASSHVARAARHVHTILGGSDAMLAGADGADNGLIAEILLSVPATSIAGGTDEIQRNIVAERVLGMPKEHRVDVDRPFSEVPKNTVGRG
jgi:alkylation response protein AidB-like acyl-CoA dehydrogenase